MKTYLSGVIELDWTVKEFDCQALSQNLKFSKINGMLWLQAAKDWNKDKSINKWHKPLQEWHYGMC